MSVRQWVGTYKGTVAQNNDPTASRRVVLRIPQILGTAQSNWAEPSVPDGAIPSIGETLWVQFSGGDVNKPIYISAGNATMASDIQALINQITSGGLRDRTIPKPPTMLQASTQVVFTSEGVGSADLTLTWVTPTENVGDTPIAGDLNGYIITWRYDGGAWSGGAYVSATDGATPVTSWTLHGLITSAHIEVRLTAFDTGGNASLPAVVMATLAGNPGPPPGSPIANVNIAIESADGKNTIYYMPFTAGPVGPFKMNDTWFVTDQDNRILRWTGAWTNALLGSDAISYLNVGKISTGEIAAGVRILAGAETGTHAEMSSSGFRVFNADPLDGIPNEVIRMGVAASNDMFAVTDASGMTVAAISDNGTGSFSSLSISGDAEFGGMTLTDIREARGKGIVAFGARGTNATVAGTTTELPYLEIQADLKADRLYRVASNEFLVQNSIVDGQVNLSLRYTTGNPAAVVGVTSPQCAFARRHVPLANGNESVSISRHLSFSTDVELRVLLSYMAETGTGLILGATSYPVELTITDLGPFNGDVGIDRQGTSVVTKKNYISTWNSTISDSYNGSGTKRTDTTDVVQGYNSSNGDGRGIWTFPSFGSLGTVSKVEVYCYASHWYYNSGGSARIGVHGYSAVPASDPGITPVIWSGSWPNPGGRWVTLPSSVNAGFASGAYKGFGLGPAGSTNPLFYGRFSGTTAKIRISYNK